MTKETLHITKKENGRYSVTMPDGQIIPQIVRDSIATMQDEELFKHGVIRVKFECYVSIDNINSKFKEEDVKC